MPPKRSGTLDWLERTGNLKRPTTGGHKEETSDYHHPPHQEIHKFRTVRRVDSCQGLRYPDGDFA